MRMKLDCTEAFENGIWAAPVLELGVDDFREVVDRLKILIVDPKASQELPDSFNRIEFWAIRRKELQDEVGLLFAPPLGVELSVVIPGVIDDEDNPPAGAGADAVQLAKELPAGLGVKVTLWLGGTELPVPESDGPEVTDCLSCGCMAANRILDLRGDPHPATAAVLLEMDLINRPKVDGGVAGQSLEFFLPPPAITGWLGPPSGGVCAAEIRIGEIASGSCAHPSSLRTAFAERPKAKGRSKAALEVHSRPDCSATPPLRGPDSLRSISTVGLPSIRRSIPQTRSARTGEPKSPRYGAHPPRCWPPSDNSSLVRPATRRGAGGRTGPRRCDVSRPAERRSSPRGPKWLMASSAKSLGRDPVMRNNLCRCV